MDPSQNPNVFHATTIVSVRRGGQVVIAGDGQVTLGHTVMKANARKVRRLGKDGRVLAGFAGHPPEESTGGGTSDARFIAPLGAQCIEIGPVNASIHQVDEHVRVADLERLPTLYATLMERLLCD